MKMELIHDPKDQCPQVPRQEAMSMMDSAMQSLEASVRDVILKYALTLNTTVTPAKPMDAGSLVTLPKLSTSAVSLFDR